MAEQAYDMQVVGFDYICDDCKSGLMNATGAVLMSYPPKWLHICNKCGVERQLDKRYPDIRFERVPA